MPEQSVFYKVQKLYFDCFVTVNPNKDTAYKKSIILVNTLYNVYKITRTYIGHSVIQTL